MKVEVIRTNGTREQHEIEGGTRVFDQLYPLAGCDTFDIVNLRDGRVMLVDDNGYEAEAVQVDPPAGFGFAIENRCVRARKPVNLEATKLYHSICKPGTTHEIVGDVIIARDEDFA